MLQEYQCPNNNKACRNLGLLEGKAKAFDSHSLTIILRARMGSESIAHEAEGLMGKLLLYKPVVHVQKLEH